MQRARLICKVSYLRRQRELLSSHCYSHDAKRQQQLSHAAYIDAHMHARRRQGLAHVAYIAAYVHASHN
eukprot:341380-Pelagomonas_calceolata.AAC.4